MTDREKLVYDALDKLQIPYESLQHKAVHTIEDCEPIRRHFAAIVPKNLFLCNRQGTRFYLLLISPDKVFRTSVLSHELNISRLSFANEDKLMERLRTQPGAISPMGLLEDTARDVTLLIDESLKSEESLIFHPCVNTASLCMRLSDFLNRFLPATGHTPTFVSLKEE